MPLWLTSSSSPGRIRHRTVGRTAVVGVNEQTAVVLLTAAGPLRDGEPAARRRGRSCRCRRRAVFRVTGLAHDEIRFNVSGVQYTFLFVRDRTT